MNSYGLSGECSAVITKVLDDINDIDDNDINCNIWFWKKSFRAPVLL